MRATKIIRLLEALEKIADPRKRHKEPDAYTEVGCLMSIANEALKDFLPGDESVAMSERLKTLGSCADILAGGPEPSALAPKETWPALSTAGMKQVREFVKRKGVNDAIAEGVAGAFGIGFDAATDSLAKPLLERLEYAEMIAYAVEEGSADWEYEAKVARRELAEVKEENARLLAFVVRVKSASTCPASVLVAGQVLEGHDVRTVPDRDLSGDAQ